MRVRDMKLMLSIGALSTTLALVACEEKSGEEAKPAEGDKPAEPAEGAKPVEASPEAKAAEAAKATITAENAVDEAAKLAAEIEKDEVVETDD